MKVFIGGFRVMAMAVLAVVGSAAVGAAAQEIIQPPIASAMDGNGVNLATGQFTMPGLDVDIGDAQSGLARVTQGDSDNWSGVLSNSFTPAQFAPNGTTPTDILYYVIASYAGTSHRFLTGHFYPATYTYSYNGNPLPELGGGSAVLSCDTSGSAVIYANHSGTCTLILQDGTRVVYDRTMTSGTTNFGPMTSVTKPNGEVTTLSYYTVTTSGVTDAKAVNAINISLGWALKYTVDGSYKVTAVTAVNTAVTRCDAGSCSPGSSSPSVSKSVSGSTTTLSRNGVSLGSYTVSGGTTTLTTPNGVTKTVNTYTSGSYRGRVSSIVAGGQTWSYAYSANTSTGDTTTTVTEPNGKTRKVVVAYNSTIKSTTDEVNRTTSYVYDSNFRIVKIVNPDGDASTGGFVAITYDSSGRVDSQQIVPKGGATSGVANTGAAIVTRYGYAACDGTNDKWCRKPTTVTDPNGVVTTYAYDGNSGEVWTATLPAPASGQSRPKVTYTYTAQTPYNYDVPGSVGTWAAAAPVYRLTKISTCRTADDGNCVNGSDEKQTLVSYASNNLLPTATTVQIGDGSYPQTTTTTYDTNGEAIVVDGPKLGAVDEIYSFYDALGRLQGTVGLDPDGAAGANHRQATHTSYDNDGNKSEVDIGIVGAGNTDAYSGSTPAARWSQAQTDWTPFASGALTGVQHRYTSEVDSYGREIVARHFIGTASTAKDVTQRSYDSMQRLDCEAVRLNPADYGSLPASACSQGTQGSDGSHDRITKYGYDALGNLTSTISGYGTGLARTDASKHYDIDSATGSGTLQYVTDAKGNKTSYYYDNFDRRIETCYPIASNGGTSNGSDCVQTSYRGLLVDNATTQATNLVDHLIVRDGTAPGSQTVTLAYDLLGRVSGKSGAVSESVTYDNFNDVVTHVNYTTGGSSATESYGYNALSWRTSDTQPIAAVSYSYDAYGRRSSMTYPGSFVVNYTYDNGDDLTDESAPGTSWHFDYDDYDRRSDIVRANGVTTYYSYDSNLRLHTLTQGTSGASFYNQVTYGYNGADQINAKSGTNAGYNYSPTANANSYGIDGLNRISAVNGGASFSYDGRGNLTGDGGTGTYSYNANNLLTSATQSGVTTSLTYDAENRLLSISKNGATTRFLYDGARLIAEYDGVDNLLRRYVPGPRSDEPLAVYDYQNGGAYTYLHADESGSIVLLTNSSGGYVAINTYDPYGLPGSGNTGRFQYTGQVWLPEIGMYYYKARLYNPVVGRFMQTDPLGYGAGMNWYAYVQNDPLNNTDSSGLCGRPGEMPCVETVTGIPTGICRETCQDYLQQQQAQANNLANWMNAVSQIHFECGNLCSLVKAVVDKHDHDPCSTASQNLVKAGNALKAAGTGGQIAALGSYLPEVFGGEALGPGDVALAGGSTGALVVSGYVTLAGEAAVAYGETGAWGAAKSIGTAGVQDFVSEKFAASMVGRIIPEAQREKLEKGLSALFGDLFSSVDDAVQKRDATCGAK